MQKTLIVRLLTDTQDVEWLLRDEQGKTTQGPERGPISQIDASQDCTVWVLVPGIDVLLTEAELPKLSQARLRKAVPFALEEQLADDVSNLHFALGNAEEGKLLPVAVVSRLKMEAWLDQINLLLKNPKCTISAMVPDTLALAFKPTAWTVLVKGQSALVRSGEFNGFGCDIENLPVLMASHLNSVDVKPKTIDCYGDNQLELDIKVTHKPLPTHTLNILVSQIKNTPLNLLQDEFQVRHQPEQTQQLFRYAGALALACILVITMADIFKISYLSSQEAQLEKQIAVVYKQIFPQSTSVVSPKKRIQRLLGTMHTSQSRTDFLSLVSEVSPIIQKNSKLTVREAIFSNNELQLRVEASDFSVLDQFTQQVKALGFTVTQSSASKSGDMIQSRIMIKREVA